MALEFLSDVPVGDAELVIRLDVDGLHALIATLVAALEARLGPVALVGDGDAAAGGEAANAFGRVTVAFLPPAPAAPTFN